MLFAKYAFCTMYKISAEQTAHITKLTIFNILKTHKTFTREPVPKLNLYLVNENLQ